MHEWVPVDSDWNTKPEISYLKFIPFIEKSQKAFPDFAVFHFKLPQKSSFLMTELKNLWNKLILIEDKNLGWFWNFQKAIWPPGPWNLGIYGQEFKNNKSTQGFSFFENSPRELGYIPEQFIFDSYGLEGVRRPGISKKIEVVLENEMKNGNARISSTLIRDHSSHPSNELLYNGFSKVITLVLR